MYVFIDNTDRTSHVDRQDTHEIVDQLQQRTNQFRFRLVNGSQPDEFEEVRCFDGWPISASTANSVTLDAEYDDNWAGIFRVGGKVYVAIGEADEETATIQTIENSSGKIKLTMTANFMNVPTAGEKVGVLSFAGHVSEVKDENRTILQNIAYEVVCLDYTRIFDKELVTDSFVDRDSRYIINAICNRFINFNQELDRINYADNTALQAVWSASGASASSPVLDTTEFREGDQSMKVVWSGSGTVTITGTITSFNITPFTSAASGASTEGVMALWHKLSNTGILTSMVLRVGSSASDYLEWTIAPGSTDWEFSDLNFQDASVTGTPDWTALDTVVAVLTVTGGATLYLDGMRILEEKHFKHYPYVEASTTIDNFKIPSVKPTEVMQRMADELGWYWKIDYERFIFFEQTTSRSAPFQLSETTNNFRELQVTYDTSRLINRQRVEGSTETSTDFYTQVREGDSITREWLMKIKFKNLTVGLDKNTSTDTMEGGTTTTNVEATSHGLSTGDYIVNRTRSNAVRKITKVDDDNFTVEAVTGQTNGDTFSKFVDQTVGVEGIDADTGNNFMSNFNEKSIRNAESEDTLLAGEFILFKYKQVNDIVVNRANGASITAMRVQLGHTNGIFDGEPKIDKKIDSRSEAVNFADAILAKYSNMVITATFETDYCGLRTGQVINIKDTASGTRNLNRNFLIQQVTRVEREWNNFTHKVVCSTLLYGALELFQQLLRQDRKNLINEEAIVNNVYEAQEVLFITDSVSAVIDDNKQTQTMIIADSLTVEVFTPPFKWGPHADARYWNLCSWS